MRAQSIEQREQLALHARIKIFVREILTERNVSEDFREGIFTSLRAEIGIYCEKVLALSWEESGVAYYFDYYFDHITLEQKNKEIDLFKVNLCSLGLESLEVDAIIEQFRLSLINLDESVNSIIKYRLNELQEGRRDFSLGEFYKDAITDLSICSIGLLTSSSELSELILKARKKVKNKALVVEVGDIDYLSSGIWADGN